MRAARNRELQVVGRVTLSTMCPSWDYLLSWIDTTPLWPSWGNLHVLDTLPASYELGKATCICRVLVFYHSVWRATKCSKLPSQMMRKKSSILLYFKWNDGEQSLAWKCNEKPCMLLASPWLEVVPLLFVLVNPRAFSEIGWKVGHLRWTVSTDLCYSSTVSTSYSWPFSRALDVLTRWWGQCVRLWQQTTQSSRLDKDCVIP